MDIETKRLLLRPLTQVDAPALAYGLNNYAVSKNLARVKFPYSLDDAHEFIERQRGFDPRSNVRAIAFRAAPEELIGIVSYEFNQTDVAEFGYWLRECCWHMGLMTEAAEAFLNHGFFNGHLCDVHSCYHLDNPNSGRILRKLGFVETHEDNNLCVAQAKPVAVMRLGLSKAHWESAQKSRAA